MGYFQIPVSWYRDETMLELMKKESGINWPLRDDDFLVFRQQELR